MNNVINDTHKNNHQWAIHTYHTLLAQDNTKFMFMKTNVHIGAFDNYHRELLEVLLQLIRLVVV